MAMGNPTPWLLMLAAWLGIATPAASRDLRLEPVSLALQPGEQATTLWLSNTGQQPLQAQVRLFSLTQEDGGEVLVPTRAVAVSPPLLEVPPLGRQRVRIVRLDAETGLLQVLVPDEELASRPISTPDLSANEHGMGRELFAGFRELAGRADQGASVFGFA